MVAKSANYLKSQKISDVLSFLLIIVKNSQKSTMCIKDYTPPKVWAII